MMEVSMRVTAGLPQLPDPPVHGGGGEPDLGGDLLHREPRILLQEPQNGEVRSIQGGAGADLP
jgi:hypothetical protein